MYILFVGGVFLFFLKARFSGMESFESHLGCNVQPRMTSAKNEFKQMKGDLNHHVKKKINDHAGANPVCRIDCSLRQQQ